MQSPSAPPCWSARRSPSPTSNAPPTGRTPASTTPPRAAPAARSRRPARCSARSTRSQRGDTRVVCQGRSSLKALKKDLKAAQKGYHLRLSDKTKEIGEKKAADLLEFNQRLFRKCKFDSIQDAVDASGNNDRVVVMPGTYTEPDSRAAPTNDPACADLLEENDEEQTEALSYAYHLKCPNDQSLINISGRAFGGNPPQPPNLERRGIPATGPCVKCNLQLEGSGPTPNDVVIDAGRVESGNAGPVGAVKDVAIRLDRADGTVIRNLTTRHADEHGIYVLETDGYRLERFKAFFNADYGVLAFTSDHGLMQKCDAAGSGDSGLYPGGSPETGEQTVEGKRRYNTEIRYCDMRHNAAGYSGTDGNAVWLHHNNLYDNANGFTTDVFTASGHPGFPQDSDLLEKNKFYSNNFNPYLPSSDIDPTVPMPVGTGMWIAGGNGNTIRNNWFFDNWRRGTMLFAVPERAHLRAADPVDPGVPALRPVDLASQPVLRQQDGCHPQGQAPAERPRLLVGPLPRQRQQLLVQQHRQERRRRERHQHAGRAAI